MYVKTIIAGRYACKWAISGKKKSFVQRLVGQLVNPRLDVLENAQQDHVVDTGADEYD